MADGSRKKVHFYPNKNSDPAKVCTPSTLTRQYNFIRHLEALPTRESDFYPTMMGGIPASHIAQNSAGNGGSNCDSLKVSN